MNKTDAVLVVEYTDPLEGFKGWLAIAGLNYPMCAGGMRVQPNLSRNHIIDMAHNMTMKMKICGLPIDGAKCGIAYDPTKPGKKAAMTRFMAAIKPYIKSCYSMGPDLNTDMAELESIARELNIPSIKMAIAKAQGMELPSFLSRYKILKEEALPGWSLGKIRAGYGVATAALTTLKHLNIPIEDASIAVQGFGSLAKGAIAGLLEAGGNISVIADSERSYVTKNGPLPASQLITHPANLLPDISDTNVQSGPRDSIYTSKCDILILAAVEKVVTEANASLLNYRAIIPGANLAVTEAGEKKLFQRGILTLPSFVAGCGGSLSMNGLFGPQSAPDPKKVLQYIQKAMADMVIKIIHLAELQKINPTQAAEKICREQIRPREKIYTTTPL